MAEVAPADNNNCHSDSGGELPVIQIHWNCQFGFTPTSVSTPLSHLFAPSKVHSTLVRLVLVVCSFKFRCCQVAGACALLVINKTTVAVLDIGPANLSCLTSSRARLAVCLPGGLRTGIPTGTALPPCSVWLLNRM